MEEYHEGEGLAHEVDEIVHRAYLQLSGKTSLDKVEANEVKDRLNAKGS